MPSKVFLWKPVHMWGPRSSLNKSFASLSWHQLGLSTAKITITEDMTDLYEEPLISKLLRCNKQNYTRKVYYTNYNIILVYIWLHIPSRYNCLYISVWGFCCLSLLTQHDSLWITLLWSFLSFLVMFVCVCGWFVSVSCVCHKEKAPPCHFLTTRFLYVAS